MKPLSFAPTKEWSNWLTGLVVGLLVGFIAAKLLERYTHRHQSAPSGR